MVTHTYDSPHAEDAVWFSMCSAHGGPEAVHDPACGACMMGGWYTPADLAESQGLFDDDFVAWYAEKNDGALPDESAWRTWEFITERHRPLISLQLGRWQVETQSGAVYLIDFDKSLIARSPGVGSELLRKDLEMVPLVKLLSVDEEGMEMIVDVRGDGISTYRSTTAVTKVTQLEDAP